MKRVLGAAVVSLVLALTTTAGAAAQDGDIAALRAKAEAGDTTAKTELGLIYAAGIGVPRDQAEAARWFRMAAEAGDARAMGRLGGMYSRGEGVPQDFAESIRWLRAGAEGGDARAMFGVGFAYRYGGGVQKDDAEAMRWYRLAADKGFVPAMLNLAAHYYKGEGTAKDDAQALQWYRAAADRGDTRAMRTVAYFYSKGLAVAKDPAEAARWTAAAAEREAEARRWAQVPTAEQMADAYPPEAAAAGIFEARVVYQCRLDGALKPVDCTVKEEQPAGHGFASAGLTLLPSMRVAAGRTGQVVMAPLQFRGERLDYGDREDVDRCAAYALALQQSRARPSSAWWTRYWIARSRLLAEQAGVPDTPERLAPQTAEAAKRLAAGKDMGWLGRVSMCSLK